MSVIDEYIAQYDGEVKQRLNLMRDIIKQSAPDSTEKISWQMPTFYLKGNLVHFAANKNHIGFYPTPSAIDAFASALVEFKTSKGAVQFPYSKPLPIAIIKEMVEYRVKENLSDANASDKE